MSTSKRIQVKTFHAAKGLESKVVIVVNTRPFDIVKENSLYVACTRASFKLIIIQDYKHFPYAQMHDMSKRADPAFLQMTVHQHIVPEAPLPPPFPDVQDHYTLDELFSFIDVTYTQELLSYLRIEILQTHFPLPTTNDMIDEDDAPIDAGLDLTRLQEEQLNRYASDMVVQSKCGAELNVTGFVGDALNMALEFHFTKSISALNLPKRKNTSRTLLVTAPLPRTGLHFEYVCATARRK